MDHVLLQALAQRKRFNSLRHAVPAGMISGETSAMMRWFEAYYTLFPEREAVDVDELQSMIRLRSGNSTPEQIQLTLRLAETLRIPVDETSIRGILSVLTQNDLAGRVGAVVERFLNGEEVDLAFELQGMSQQAVRTLAQSAPDDYIDTPIGDLLAEVSEDKGLKLRRWACTREHILGLQGGASVAIAARPDKGKTSLIAAILTDLAPQLAHLKDLFGEGRPILWLNNEGSGKRIIPRIYQAALGMDLNGIIALSNAGKLEEAYCKAIGGPINTIRVKDMHGSTLSQIDQVIEQINPSVVVGDMLGNFRLSSASNGANKADMIEQIWQEWREMMVRHDCVGFGTVQVSVEGGNQLYPPYSALKDSKTGIQGAVDIILMMGALDNPDPGIQCIRGLSSPKNKFAAPGKPSCFQAEMYFDGAKCIFNDGSGATPEK